MPPVREEYHQRLTTWEQWQDVSLRAFGPGGDAP